MADRESLMEFDVYVPLKTERGVPIASGKITKLKRKLLQRFGGVTYFPQRNEGLWKMGDFVFRDKIVICRVIGPQNHGTKNFLSQLKRNMQKEWKQTDVLILGRPVQVV